ncbi:hypothetical protein SF123566_9900 [Shigella flexneri 1235-66]|nr:hypothetical protein SF123566_9900 [Shigella flexneri 1235-66]
MWHEYCRTPGGGISHDIRAERECELSDIFCKWQGKIA